MTVTHFIPVLISLHQALFVLLPIVLAARMLIQPRPATLEVAQGVLRFCLGCAKGILLVDPLWQLAAMILRGGPDSLSTGVAWMGFLALLLSLHFIFTAAGDLLAGLGGLLGFVIADNLQEIFTLRRFTHGRLFPLLGILIVLTIFGMLLQTTSWSGTWPHLKALALSPPRTTAALFQEARVWTDVHVITMIAALACLIGLPHSRDVLRVPAPWKATLCLLTFLLAMALLWTHAVSLS